MDTEISLAGWTQDLETGIEILDHQHKRYFELLNDYLQKADKASTLPEEVLELAETFNFLRQYAREHFSTEESIMINEEYPDYQSHCDEHVLFLTHVEDLYNRMKTTGFNHKLAREVHYYTVEWFIEHIRITDMRLVDFLNKKTSQ